VETEIATTCPTMANPTTRATTPRALYRAVSGEFSSMAHIQAHHSLILVFHQSENSSEQYTDYGGTDLLVFFRDTLNKNPKDRNILLKIEKDLIDFVQENR